MDDLLLKIENLNKEYKTKNGSFAALKDVSLEIMKNDIYGIIGLSGAGKSTLIRCINLLEKPNSGDIIFDGVNLNKVNKKILLEKRQKMGMIFQNFNLFDQRNVLKNVLYPLEIAKVDKEQAKRKAIELLKLVGLEDKLDSYPSQLSGGQKQRVAIARALANNPKILLCDEPTSALDPNTTVQILNLLKEINEKLGITIIIITHEMKVIETICNKVSIIDNSEIVEQGYVKELFKHPKTSIAKQLILPVESFKLDEIKGEKFIRIVFDGTVTKPIISDLILECKCEIIILSSNIKTLENKSYGQMIIQIPDDIKIEKKIMTYFKNRNIDIEEVTINDFDNN